MRGASAFNAAMTVRGTMSETEYMLRDPRIVEEYRLRVEKMAKTSFEASKGTSDAQWNEHLQNKYAMIAYADRYFNALRDGKGVPEPTSKQMKGGVGPLDVADIIAEVNAVIEEHVECITRGSDTLKL